MPRVVEEFIYPAMEDFRIDIVLGEGINARTISMPLKRFTLIGATTRSGMLSGPMRDRFKMHEHLEFYTVEELAADRPRQRREAADADHRRRGRWSWPGAAAARRASPTPGCGGRATTPPARPTARITLDVAQAAPGDGRGRPRGAGQAGPPLPGDADRRLRRRPDRRRGAGGDDEPADRHAQPTRSSRTCCASSSSSARRAAGWRRRRRTSTWARSRRGTRGGKGCCSTRSRVATPFSRRARSPRTGGDMALRATSAASKLAG